MNWIDEAMNDYLMFLKKSYKKTDLNNGWYSITTPFYNMFNDAIEIYCTNKNGKIILSDDGETISNLELAGLSLLRSKSKKNILQQILLNYGVTCLKDNELVIETDMNGFAQAKHNLLCAITEVSDMHVMIKQNVPSVFKEKVANYLTEQNIIYTPSFIAKGHSGLEFNFAFQIAGRKTELLINTFNIVNKDNIAKFIFDWADIKEARENLSQKEVRGMAIINDKDKEIDPKYIDAFKKKNTGVILYSKRHQQENIKKLIVA